MVGHVEAGYLNLLELLCSSSFDGMMLDAPVAFSVFRSAVSRLHAPQVLQTTVLPHSGSAAHYSSMQRGSCGSEQFNKQLMAEGRPHIEFSATLSPDRGTRHPGNRAGHWNRGKQNFAPSDNMH